MYTSVSNSAASCGTKAMQNFFSNWHLHDALFCFNRLMTAACADKLLLNTVPSNQLFFVNELKRLAEGASLALMEELGRRCIEEYLQISNTRGIAGKNRRTPVVKREEKQKENAGQLQIDKDEILRMENPTGLDQPAQWMNAPLGGAEWQNFPF